jgi:Protein of unknown function (DUF4236)
MGFRFHKRIRLLKGVYWNIGKKGSSLSIGGRCATMNVSKKGVRETFAVPGTGISYQTKRVAGSGCLATPGGHSGLCRRIRVI